MLKVSIWTEKKIVESDEISMLALALFIIATAGLESMMMVSSSSRYERHMAFWPKVRGAASA